MTLCMAALCSDEEKAHVIALVFDREIQTEIASAQTGFKIRVIGANGWKALIAGSVPASKELTDIYRERMEESGPPTEEEAVLEYLRTSPRILRRRKAEALVQSKFSITYEDFLEHGESWLGVDAHRQTLYEIGNQTINDVELILFGWISGKPVLYKLSGGEIWQCGDFAAIGSGAIVAEPVLYQREQRWTASVQETLYILYEAKKLAEITPGVGEKTLVAVDYGGPLKWLSPRGEQTLQSQFQTFGPKPFVLGAWPDLDYEDDSETSSGTD